MRRSRFRIMRIWRISFGVSAMLSFAILAGLLFPFSKEIEETKAVTDLTGEPSITLTSTKTSASVSINPTPSGVFATTSGSSNIAFSVSTDNYTGYKLSVRSDKTTLDQNSNSFTALSSGITQSTFSSGSNTQYNNKWGYRPNYYNSSSNSRYYGISTTATTLDQTSAANSTAKSYDIALGARADSSLPSGTYLNNNLIIEAVANEVPSSILTVNYGAGVSSISVGGTVIPNGDTVVLIRGVSYAITMATNTDYTFGSWDASSGTIGSTSTQSTTYTIGSSDATLTGYTTFTGVSMQNLTSSSCTTTARLAKDTRDNRVYTIKRLADGNCWMMENLDLGRTSLTTNLTSSNSNVSTTVTSSTFNGWKKTSGTGTYTAGQYIPVDGTDSTSGTAYGVLYNYYAATAGTITGSSNSLNATSDICPAGWRLPTGGSSGEQRNLYYNSSYNTYNKARAAQSSGGLALSLAGQFYTSSPTLKASGGTYWSSSMNDATTMYDMYLSTSAVTPANNNARTYGFSIRCVMKKTTHTLTVNYGTGVSDVKVNNVTVANGGTVSLEEGVAYPITMTPTSYYVFDSWSKTAGTLGSSSSQTTTYTIGTGNATLTANAKGTTYVITLNGNGATTAGSTSTNATYGSSSLSSITLPQRSHTISGFTTPSGNNASSATVSSTSTLTSTYTFNGWYKESSATNKIASNATTPVLQANTTYTNASGQWTSNSGQTLYAGWTGQSKTLPTISKSGYDCGWTTTSTGATTITYASGGTLTPTSNTTLYGVCVAKTYTINLTNTNATTSGSTSTTVTYGSSTLGSITNPSRSYTISGFSTSYNNASGATVSSTASKTYSYVFAGWYTSTSGGTRVITSGKALVASTSYTNSSAQWTSTSGTTLYAQWSNGSVTLPTITKSGHDCGWTTSTSSSTITYASGGTTLHPTSNTTLYGVCTGKTYTITLNGNGATTAGSTSTTATYGSSNLASITVPQRKYTISGFTTPSGNNASSATVSSSSTLTSTYTFNGWYKESGATNKIASSATIPALQASTSYTNASAQWTSTSAQTLYAGWTSQAKTLPTITKTGYTCGWTTTSSGATSIQYASGASFTPTANTTLYGVCTGRTYTITLNGNGATTAGSSSTTATYGSSSLASITVPQRKYTISGFTAPSGNNASGASVSSTSTLTSTYTFNGWYKESSATNKIASNATIPALQASTSYTNSSAQWTSTSAQTLYAGWTAQTKTLPTITKSGKICGWTTASSGGTSIEYASGGQITPTANITLYGICGKSISDLTYMQDFRNLNEMDKSTVLASMSYNTNYSLIDNRDNKTYKIARLKDDKIWMADNLDLGRSNLSTNLTSSNTNLSSTISASTFNGWRITNYSQETNTNGEFISITTSNSGNSLDTDSTSGIKYGTLYNFYAASAGTISGSPNSNSAQYDICPAGWRLPTCGYSYESATLYTSYNSSFSSMRASITSGGAAFAMAGLVSGYKPTGQGTYGYYWCSNNSGSNYRKVMILSSNSFSDGGNQATYCESIRCVAK